MSYETLHAPSAFLRAMLRDNIPATPELDAYDAWWRDEGSAISAAVDRAGNPHLRMFDTLGMRVDEIQYPPDYARMIQQGYRAGVIWRGRTEECLLFPFLLGYVTSFYDPGAYCPYVVSLGTWHAIDKYAAPDVKARFHPLMEARDKAAWQGATWMTEARGGSDLGAAVETIARSTEHGWRLTGDKYFASNAGAELAVVAARPEGAPDGVRGLALFLVPRNREDGSLNYTIRRLKDKIATRSVPTGEVELRDSEAYLLGEAQHGIYLIMEILNLSRTANAMGCVALAQRALSDAYNFACQREAFGSRLIDLPLMRSQFSVRMTRLEEAFALAYESALWGNYTSRELPGYYSDSYQLYRLLTHLAKFWTAELAVDMARWAMEVHGGAGTLAENGVERWLREAMILDIWEGPPNRQILDGWEVMARRNAHNLLGALVGDHAGQDGAYMLTRIAAHLALPPSDRGAGAESLFRKLAGWAAEALHARRQAEGGAGAPILPT